MLALLERLVTDAGGTLGVCRHRLDGGRLERGRRPRSAGLDARVLSWAEAEAIRERFAALNPYDRTAVPGSILKLEDREPRRGRGRARARGASAISAKRYALFTRSTTPASRCS